jgi:two-component system NtrC family sensor kinase
MGKVASKEEERAMSSERILVVDDEPRLVKACTETLAGEGYQAHGAGGGREALACLEEKSFDILLTDIKMPDVDGLTVLRRARELDPDLTVVIITGFGTLQNAIDALRAGARGFLLKPFSPDDLLLVVREALEERRQEQENMLLRARLPILDISQTLMAEGDVVSLAGQLLESVVQQIGADRASLMLLDEETGELYIARAIGLPVEVVNTTRLPTRQGIVQRVLLGEEPLVLDGETNRDPLLLALMGRPDVAAVCVPLRTSKGALGVLNLSRSVGSAPFTPSELNLLSIMSNQIAVALDNARLYETVARSKREWEATFDAITDGISIHDREFTIVQANRTLARMLDVPLETLIGQKCYQVFHGKEMPAAWCPHQQMLAEGVVKTAERDDPQLGGTYLISAYPLRDTQGEMAGSVHVLKNITQRKREQKQLLQSEKLPALGRLAASLAHEINNPLQALSNGLRLLNRPGLNGEKRQQYLALASREVERLIGIVERMIGFYRPSADAQSATDVCPLLDEILTLAEKKLQHSHVTVQRDWSDELPHIQAVANQLKQVFLNLILNAMYAMPDGGTLTISADRTKDDSAISIRFADTGHGIAPEHLDHIFEPFYTTRPDGTGLGLSISYSIVQQHGGRIEVESEPDQGTTFTVTLPITGD